MRISDWSSDVCSSDLHAEAPDLLGREQRRLGNLLRGRVRGHLGIAEEERATLQDEYAQGRCVADAGLQPDDIERDRKSGVSGKSGAVRVELGGVRIIKNKKENR